MWQSKTTMSVVVVFWLLISMFYYNIFSLVRTYTNNNYNVKVSYFYRTPVSRYNETENFLINTPGCYIPNYSKTIRFKEAKYMHRSCNERAIFVNKTTNNDIYFHISNEKMKDYNKSGKKYQCCYRFASRSTVSGNEDVKITYTTCTKFENGTKVKLKQEVITVTCKTVNSEKVIYEDAYVIVKTKETEGNHGGTEKWNVLMLGMDTMSRARAFHTMPQTMEYLKQKSWLDFKGYQKVGYNTFPNLMAVLTGKKMSTIYKQCARGMHACNHLMLWSIFQRGGYVTAYGEDFLKLPDTFYRYKGFKIPPTDHYMRPFFLTGETQIGNLVCTKALPSATHILDYAFHFSDAYKKNKHFGMFWLNSYSHNLNNMPSLFDNLIVEFLEKLNNNGVLNNTFVILFSDHGIRYGQTRFLMESYYEERLPMFFMWIPQKFREQYEDEYYNLQLNQNRLTTAYDLHVTLGNILQLSNRTKYDVNSEACPQCTSMFQEISKHRTCADANVDEKWCTCHNMSSVDRNEVGAKRSLQLAVSDIQNLTKVIDTDSCTACSDLKLKKVLRNHLYRHHNNNSTYYVIAFQMSPGDIGYEAVVRENSSEFSLVQRIETISQYNTKGNCVKNPNDRSYCVCEKLHKCNKTPKR